jgi:hypothetical protein
VVPLGPLFICSSVYLFEFKVDCILNSLLFLNEKKGHGAGQVRVGVNYPVRIYSVIISVHIKVGRNWSRA